MKKFIRSFTQLGLSSLILISLTTGVLIWITYMAGFATPVRFSHRFFENGFPTIATRANAKDVVVYVSENDSVVWKSGRGNPPLTAKKAIDLASAKRKKMFPDDHKIEWLIEFVQLVPADVASGLWFWEVHFRPDLKQGESIGFTRNLILAVSMNGTVCETKVTSEDGNE